MICNRTRRSLFSSAGPRVRDRSQGGFTLVELLVVTAIISVLAGMLLPVLDRALLSARTIACANNQKQIGYALGEYLSENSELLPFHPNGSTLGWVGKKGLFWSHDSDSKKRFVNPYLGVTTPGNKVAVAACPCDKGQPPSFSNTYEASGASYMMNYRAPVAVNGTIFTLSNGTPFSAFNLRQVKETSRTVFFGDHPMFNYVDGTIRNQFWHDMQNMRVNICFIDMHVNFVLVPPPGSSAEYPNTGLYKWNP